jgi:hypothetical protein
MKLTTNTNVSVDGVMQGLGGPDEDRRGGFERGGWVTVDGSAVLGSRREQGARHLVPSNYAGPR